MNARALDFRRNLELLQHAVRAGRDFGDLPPRVARLQGAIKPAPVPPGWEASEMPRGLPLTEILESDRGPWQAAGKYGRAIDYEFPATVDASPALVFNIDKQLGPPRARCIQLFRSDSIHVAGAGLNAEVYCKLTYGVGGVQNVAFLDWSRGGQISVVADSLTVEAVAYAPQAGSAYNPPAIPVLLGAMLAQEGTTPARPPTFTTQQITTAAAESASFQVPDFARWVFPMWTNVANTTDVMSMRNFGTTQLKRLLLNADLVQLGTPVPGGVTEIILINIGPNGQGFSLQFELGL